MDETPTYQPGTCNIGAAERAYRRTAGRGLVAIGAIVAVPPLLLGATAWTSLLLAPFAFVATVNLLQDRHGFCVHYARLGRHAMGDLGDTTDVVEDEQRAADVARARQLLWRSAAAAALVTAAHAALLLLL